MPEAPMEGDTTIHFPLELGTGSGPAEIRCSEAVAAAWNTAVACVGTRSTAMMMAYLREASTEAAREAGKTVTMCAQTLATAEREAFEAILATSLTPDDVPANQWLLLRSTFQVLRAAYDR